MIRKPWGWEVELGQEDMLRISFEYETYKHIFKTLRQNSWGPPHTDADKSYFALSCITVDEKDSSLYSLVGIEREWQEYKTQNSEEIP